MFNLCKTVKIYHTVNHYHPQQPPKDPSELQFHEAPPPSKEHTLPSHHHIRMVESHSMSPKKRCGIDVSLKEPMASPYKQSQITHYHDLSRTHHRHSSTFSQNPSS
jgi:hypothetical protein